MIDSAPSSRRLFLKTAGATTAASSLMAGVSRAGLHAGSDETVQLALVGCGGRGGGAASNALSTDNGPVKLVAMADVFPKNLQSGNTTLVSVDSLDNEANGPSSGPTISDDGRYVAFASFVTNLVTLDDNGQTDIFVRDLIDEQTVRVSVDANGQEANNSTLV